MATGWCSALAELRPDETVCVPMKWVGLRPDVDQLTGSVATDDRFAGASLADRAALEIALRIAASRDLRVRVVCVGPPEADRMLRDALAVGATSAQRIDPGLGGAQQPTSAAVAAVLRTACDGAAMVVCGDWSLDRGSGSVPPMLALLLGLDQACGLVAVEVQPDALIVERRLDGGRREVLRVTGHAVLSVEGSVASLRRASIAGVLAAKQATIDVVHTAMSTTTVGVRVERVESHRPPPRHLHTNDSSDPRDRVSALLGVGAQRTPPLRMALDPDAAADVIIERLVAWGQIPS